MLHVDEDGERAPQSGLRGVPVTRGLMDVGEIGEGLGLSRAGVQFAVEAERALVVVDGGSVVAEPVVRVAEAVEDVGLAGAVVERPHEDQRLLTAGERRRVVPGQGVDPPDRVEGRGLAGQVPGGPVGVEGALVAVDPLGEGVLRHP